MRNLERYLESNSLGLKTKFVGIYVNKSTYDVKK